MNSRALALAIALLALPSAARADGPPPVALPPPAVACCAPPTPWTGFYIGTHAGASWADPDWTFPVPAETFNPGQNFSTSARGPIWGGHIGFNYQIHHFLIGTEVSYAGSRLSDTITSDLPNLPPDQGTYTVAQNDLFTVTGRLGFVHSNFLLYGKAGYANSSMEVKFASTEGTTASATRRESGWTVGGGVEARMISNIIFGLEYNYVNLPGDRFSASAAGTTPGQFTADISDIHEHTFLARLSVLFGPSACCSEGLLGKY